MGVIKDSLPGEWMLQPTLNKKSPGFVRSEEELNKRLAKDPDDLKTTNETVEYLKKSGQLKNF